MPGVGEYLRRAREEKSVQLEQISDTTKIRLCYLEALEDESYDIIPGEAYVRGFLKNYAEAIGLNAREVLDMYDDSRNPARQAPAPQDDEADARAGAAARALRISWWQPTLVVGVLLLLALAIWLGRVAAERPKPVPPAQTDMSQEIQEPPAVVGEEPATQIELTLRFKARCWVVITCDGLEVLRGTQEAGTEKTFSAANSIVGQFGNAGGVQVEMNGKDLGTLGITGKSVTREFRLDGRD